MQRLSRTSTPLLAQLQRQAFAAKKAKMELTLRTPYKTICEKFDGFQRILTRSNEAALVIQNRSPPELFILPPGELKLKLTQETEGVASYYLHTGGWCTIHADNSCEILVTDIMEKHEVKPDQFDKVQLQDKDDVAGKYVAKLRKITPKLFTKKVTN